MPRKLPLLTPENRPFWTGGADGRLMICHCRSCGQPFHPPGPVCPLCGHGGGDIDAVEYRPVSGKGTVISYTINHQPWTPGLEVPLVIAVVGLVERDGLRFVTNIVDMPIDGVRVGLPVRVVFENIEDVWLPLFTADV